MQKFKYGTDIFVLELKGVAKKKFDYQKHLTTF